MIEQWIDKVQQVWAGISGNGFNSVYAPLMVQRAEFPSALDAKTLGVTPVALSIVGETKFLYSAGGPNLGYYQGVTELHVAPNTDKALLPSLLQWQGLIAVKAAANLQLGGLVEHFALQDRDDQITGPIAMQYGDEAEHWGFLVYWEVKENVNATIAVGIGA